MLPVRSGLALVALLVLPLGACRSATATATPALASCPQALPSGDALPKGARLIGSAPRATSLRTASVVDQSPAQVRPDGDFLAEIESESADRQGVRRTATWFDSSANPVSLVCRYGGVTRPGRGTAMLLVPLPAGITGECVVTSDLRVGTKGRPSATCTRARQ